VIDGRENPHDRGDFLDSSGPAREQGQRPRVRLGTRVAQFPTFEEGEGMRKSLAVLVGMAVATLALAAQTHDNQTERLAKDTVTLTADLKVGTTTLSPGEYAVRCDTKVVSFTRKDNNKKVVEMPCKGTMLSKKADSTVLHTSTNAAGERVLDKFLLRGSNVEHVFK
jgi:hypothetical protein